MQHPQRKPRHEPYHACYLPSPAWVVKKRTVLNVKAYDLLCFAWVLLRARYPVPQFQRRSVNDLVMHFDELVLPEGVRYPILLDEKIFHDIEQLNPWCSFSVFILGEKEGDVKPFYVSMLKGKRPLHVCVGAIVQPHDPKRAHYVFIRRFDFLMGKACDFQRFYCEKCLALHRANTIRQHEAECYGLGVDNEDEQQEKIKRSPLLLEETEEPTMKKARAE